jgi:ATP-dependent Clp protease ATP-binding subunit ClpA
MLERFSDQACRVVVRARDEARALNHNWIGTEHLMPGLIGEGSGMAAQVPASLGISPEAARWLVEEIIDRGDRPPSGQLQFTPRAKKVLEMGSGRTRAQPAAGRPAGEPARQPRNRLRVALRGRRISGRGPGSRARGLR